MKSDTKEIHYYSPKKILSMKDLDGDEPTIYMVTTNRSAGKTTAFLKKSLVDFKERGAQTVLLYRYQYELSAAADIYKDVLNMNFELGIDMKVKSCANGLFYQLFLDDKPFGFSVALSNPDSLKKYSPVFASVQNIIMDEFQSEKGNYLPKEIEKFQSVYLTIARGGGAQSRDVKVFMLGNMVTVMNPYFIEFGVHKRLKDTTNFLRGNGWVGEFSFNESASKAIKSHGFFKAFQDEDYMSYSTEKVYLHDATIFIEKPKGRFKYICTIVHDGTSYGVREYFDEGVVYVSHKPDNSCKNTITFKAADHNQNTIMLSHYSYLWKNIKDAFQNGYLRFDDMRAKSAIFDILSVDIYK